MLRLAAIVATAAVAVQSSTIEEFQCTDGDCKDCIQLANITTGKCYDDPQEGDLFVVAGCDDTRLVEMFYSDDKCANAAGKKQVAVGTCVGPDLNHNFHIRHCVQDEKSVFKAAIEKYNKVTAPMVKYSFTFTGDGDNNQAPTHGCFEQDNGCQMCIQAWWNYPPDASYKYEPIVSKGCPSNTTLQECDFCPPGLTFYQ